MYLELYGTHKFVSEFKVIDDAESFKLKIGFLDGVEAHFVSDENGLVIPTAVGVKDEDKGIYFSGPLVDGSAITVGTLMAYLWKYCPAIPRTIYGEPVVETVQLDEKEEY